MFLYKDLTAFINSTFILVFSKISQSLQEGHCHRWHLVRWTSWFNAHFLFSTWVTVNKLSNVDKFKNYLKCGSSLNTKIHTYIGEKYMTYFISFQMYIRNLVQLPSLNRNHRTKSNLCNENETKERTKCKIVLFHYFPNMCYSFTITHLLIVTECKCYTKMNSQSLR